MRYLNVLDLDGTLLPYDSFRLLLRRNLNARIAVIAALRRTKLLSRRRAAELFVHAIAPLLEDERRMRTFLDDLVADVRVDVLSRVKTHTDQNTTNLLLSSSPEQYVAPLAAQLGFVGAGSRSAYGAFFHCFGPNKLVFLAERFPRSLYEYRFAVSDHPSDLPLLRCFQRYELLNPRTGAPRCTDNQEISA